MLAQAALEVGGDNVRLAVDRIEGGKLAVGGDADMGEGADIEEAVLAVGPIDDIDSPADAQQHLDGAGEGETRGDDGPGMDLALRRRGQHLGPRLIVGSDRDEDVVGE